MPLERAFNTLRDLNSHEFAGGASSRIPAVRTARRRTLAAPTPARSRDRLPHAVRGPGWALAGLAIPLALAPAAHGASRCTRRA